MENLVEKDIQRERFYAYLDLMTRLQNSSHVSHVRSPFCYFSILYPHKLELYLRTMTNIPMTSRVGEEKNPFL